MYCEYCYRFHRLHGYNNLQDKSETEKDYVELEERKFEPSSNDKDLVEILGNVIITLSCSIVLFTNV